MNGLPTLLGARLPATGPLLGVVYLGRRQGAFTARDACRLEILAAVLATQLGLASTHRALAERVHESEVERELRERYVSTLAHDLRSPLSSAATAARLLRDAPDLPEDRRAVADRILRGVGSTDHMVRDLLDASRIRAGKRLSLTLERTDLLEVVRGAVAELSAVYGDLFRIEGTGPVVGVWSPRDLHRIVTNLGSNAVKYGAQGAPVTLTVARTASGAELRVHNEGPHLTPAELAGLFKPFARAKRALVLGRQRGWGLGLSVVKGSTEAHGGTVAIESAPGRGTTFQIALPLDARPFQPEPVLAAPAAAASTDLDVEIGRLPPALRAAAADLAAQRYSACLLDADGVIRFANAAWDRFARENAGAPANLAERIRGTRWLDHITGAPERAHFAELLQRALRGALRWPGVVRVSECNTPEKARLLVTRYEPVEAAGAAAPVGVAIHHAVVLERGWAARCPTGDLPPPRLAADGLLLQCPECGGRWDGGAWVFAPALVGAPPPGALLKVCPSCVSSYFLPAP